MPKYPRNKKGKQPLRPRGLGGRWTSRPDPDPPDDQGAEAHSVTESDDKPVTAGVWLSENRTLAPVHLSPQ